MCLNDGVFPLAQDDRHWCWGWCLVGREEEKEDGERGRRGGDRERGFEYYVVSRCHYITRFLHEEAFIPFFGLCVYHMFIVAFQLQLQYPNWRSIGMII